MATNSRSKYYNITIDGISLRIDKSVMNDVELVELMGDLQDGNVFVFAKLSRLLFGEDGYEKVKKELEGKNGRTKMSDMSEFFLKAFKACGAVAAKN